MDTTTIDSRIEPYSPEWFKLRQGCFTGSEIWKLMSKPRGKGPMQKYMEFAGALAGKQERYGELANKSTKTAIKLKAKIDEGNKAIKELYEKRNDLHISDTAETYILEKVHEKLTGITKSGIDNAATQWGIENEPLAKRWYAKLTNQELSDPYMKFHPTIEGFSCTPDTLASRVPLAEIKCPYNGANHLKYWLINSPEYMKENHDDHFYQCYSQMSIFGAGEEDFVSFDPRIDSNRGLLIFNLQVDETELKEMEAKIRLCRVLYHDYLKVFTPPEI